jgi:predicted dehydrogenase
MGAVMSAIATGSPVRSSVRDNVNTLKLVDALYRSMDSGVSVKL